MWKREIGKNNWTCEIEQDEWKKIEKKIIRLLYRENSRME